MQTFGLFDIVFGLFINFDFTRVANVKKEKLAFEFEFLLFCSDKLLLENHTVLYFSNYICPKNEC